MSALVPSAFAREFAPERGTAGVGSPRSARLRSLAAFALLLVIAFHLGVSLLVVPRVEAVTRSERSRVNLLETPAPAKDHC